VVGLTVTASPLVRLLAEESYFDGYRAVWLVAAASMFFGFGQLGSFGMLLTQHTGVLARNQFIVAALSLALNFMLVPWMGFMGAAVSACLAFLVLAALQARESAKYLTWRWPLKTLARVLAAAAAMAASIIVLNAAMAQPQTTRAEALQVLSFVVLGAVVYGSMLFLLGEVSLSSFTKRKSGAEALLQPAAPLK
jgi:O-antigen/teichoic acid export membrane protein